MHKAIAFGCIAISAVLAALYGYTSADTEFYGGIRAASLGAVAVVGACCPAWASTHWAGRRYGQCAITWIVCLVCLAVTLGGGIGTIAGGADHSTAERAKAAKTAKNNDAELARVSAELAKLPARRPVGTVKADIETARAGRAYKASDGCEPEKITSKAVREACEAFRKLEGELETAKTAERLEARVTALSAVVAKAPAVQHANPQAAAISTLLHVDVDAATSLYAFIASLALELAGMAAMMRADAPMESTRRKPGASQVEAPAEIAREMCPKPDTSAPRKLAPKRPLMIAGTVLPPASARPVGDVKRFLLACLPRAIGEEVSLGAVYARYQRWCDDTGAMPLSTHLLLRNGTATLAFGVRRALDGLAPLDASDSNEHSPEVERRRRQPGRWTQMP